MMPDALLSKTMTFYIRALTRVGEGGGGGGGGGLGMSSIVDKSINHHFDFVNQMESKGWVSNQKNRYSVPQ